MRDWRKWRKGGVLRREAARRAARVRWDREHEARAGEAVRVDLPVVALRVTIQQVGQPMRVLELRRNGGKRTWMFENGRCAGPGGKCLLFRLAERSTHL